MLKKFFLIIFILLTTCLLFIGWWQGSGTLIDNHQSLLALGRLTGLVAVYGILWEFVLAGKITWLEEIISLDKSLTWHHKLGLIILLSIIAHPILLGFSYGKLSGNSFWQQQFSFLTGWEDMASAFVSLILFSLAIGFSIKLIKRSIKYEWWYGVHLLTYLALLLSFGHQLENGGDIIANNWFKIYWITLIVLMLGIFIFYRLVKPLRQYQKHQFFLEKIIKESDTTYSLYIQGKKLADYQFAAGQFANLRFLTKKHWAESHPFSYSHEFNGKFIRFTVKNLGDFSSNVKNLKPGTKVIIDGQHGVMTARASKQNKCLLIAGGIGITPLRSLARELIKEGKQVSLLYAYHSENEAIFKEELDSLPSLKITYFNSDNNRLDIQTLADKINTNTDYYICGPWTMITNFLSVLRNKISKKNIHFEKFSF